MKKVASLLLIFVLAFTMGVGAFADGFPTELRGGTMMRDGNMHDDDANNIGGALPRDSRNRSTLPGAMPYDSNNDDIYVYDDFMGFVPMISMINENQVSIGAGEIFLVREGGIVLPEYRLTPNREYIFDIYFNSTNAPVTFTLTNAGGATPDTLAGHTALVRLTDEHLSGPVGTDYTGRLRLRSGRGSTMFSRTDLRTRGTGPSRTYQLLLETRANYTTRLTDVTFTMLTSGNLPTVSAGAANPQLSVIELVVGWRRMSDDEVDTYAEGDTVTLTNDYPVIMRRQIERLVRNHNYRPIHLAFEDGSWEYTGRMSGMADTNFFTTQDVIPPLMNRFDQDFKFLSLPGGATFPTNGEMRIDVSDVSGDWDRIYTYLYRNGTLTPISTTYDSMDDMIYFRTNFLGSFVMTDVEITDRNLLVQPGQPEITEPEEPGYPNLHNPPMGVAGFNNLFLSLGTLSLLGAGAALIRRRK